MTEPDRDTVVAVLRDHGAVFALVFGSRSAEGIPRPDSDFDLAAWWPADPPASWDVPVPAGVDLLVLNTAPLEPAGRTRCTARCCSWTTRLLGSAGWPPPGRSGRTRSHAGSGPTASSWKPCAVVDELRVQRLLRGMADTIGFLEAERDQPEQVRAQRRWLDSVKYNFVTAIEAAVDAGQHNCATEQWGPPDTNAATFRILRDHGVLSPDVAEAMARASGFRDVLVHEYVEVRDDLVVANLDRLPDLRAFVAEVAGWLAAS